MQANAVVSRLAIYDVLVAYAEAIDRRDLPAVAQCFTSDARARYAGTDVGPGREAIVGYLSGHLTSIASTHIVGNVRITVSSDTSASSESLIRATHVVGQGDRTRLQIRCLRYSDVLVRDGEQWQIARRIHRPLWATEVDGEFLA
jgi:hypothetical protein